MLLVESFVTKMKGELNLLHSLPKSRGKKNVYIRCSRIFFGWCVVDIVVSLVLTMNIMIMIVILLLLLIIIIMHC